MITMKLIVFTLMEYKNTPKYSFGALSYSTVKNNLVWDPLQMCTITSVHMNADSL